MRDPKLDDEAGRVAALNRYCVLDTQPEEPFDKITSLVQAVFDVPICAVSLVDSDRQWFKAGVGLDVRETPRSIAFCHHTIQESVPLVIPDATLDPRFANNPLVTDAPRIRSYAGVPLRTAEGYNVGSLCAIDTKPRSFEPAQLAILQNFGALVVDELELRTIALKDHLTGALSRRGFMEAAAKELERATRYGRRCALIAFDVDHFKRINDQHGHAAGDEVLKAVASASGSLLRINDLFGRIGGEEFGIVLPEASLGDAMACAERIRTTLEGLADRQLCPFPVTASFGVSELEAEQRLDQWLAKADSAAYVAKRSGRNRCVAHADLQQPKQAA